VWIDRGTGEVSIFFPIETAARELPYKLLLAMTLAKRGIPAYVGCKSSIRRLLRSETKYLYIDKGFHPGQSEEIWRRVHKRGGLIVSLDEEGAVDYPGDVTLRHRYSPVLFNGADQVFLWGRRQLRFVPDSIKDKHRVMVTGHPRFQMLLPRYRALYERPAAALRKEFGEFILVNTNMGFGNSLRGDEFVRQNYRARFSRIDDIISLDRRKLVAFLDAIRVLAKSSSRMIVVRPHPEERIETYTQALSDLPNVRVIFRGSAVPWIAACSSFVHPDCTTAIEAVFLGRPAISLVPVDAEPALLTQLPLLVSTRVTNAIDLVAAVLGPTVQEVDLSEITPVLDDWFSIHQDSIALIVARLSELWVSAGNTIPRGLSSAARWSLFGARLAAMWRPREPLLTQKLNNFSRETVDAEQKAIKNVSPELASVRVQFLESGVLCALP
jgi:surface carbohydrate biosynthesis protein